MQVHVDKGHTVAEDTEGDVVRLLAVKARAAADAIAGRVAPEDAEDMHTRVHAVPAHASCCRRRAGTRVAACERAPAGARASARAEVPKAARHGTRRPAASTACGQLRFQESTSRVTRGRCEAPSPVEDAAPVAARLLAVRRTVASHRGWICNRVGPPQDLRASPETP